MALEALINSPRMIEELRTFIYKNGKAIALDGYHDDLTMAYSIALWVRSTAYTSMQQRDEYEKKKSEWITQRVGDDTDNSIFTNGKIDNPYTMEYGDNRNPQKENLLEWL